MIKNKEIKVLDKGFVKLIDWMGDDNAVVQAARVSYNEGSKGEAKDKGLINYLMENGHTSPFEMCEIKLHIKCPIFVARQWGRHRTANVNEISARYTEVKDEFYTPKEWRGQSKDNKQMSDGVVEISKELQDKIEQHDRETYEIYQQMLEEGVSRELARSKLDVGYYTEFYWKIDLHNLLHFLNLRMHEHAQQEIREYANAIAEIVKEWCPWTWGAFEEHALYAVKFSRTEKELILKLIGEYYDLNDSSLLESLKKIVDKNNINITNKGLNKFYNKLIN